MKTLLGYSDVLSVRAGGKIGFMVSCEKPTPYEAQIVRIINGDTNPAGPGYREEEVDAACWHVRGRPQKVRAGSCLVVPHSPALRVDGFGLDILVWPTTPAKREQVVASFWDPVRDAGFQLMIEQEGVLALRLGDDRGGVAVVRLEATMRSRRWYRLAASFNPRDGLATISQTPIEAELAVKDAGEATVAVAIAGLGDVVAPFVVGARPARDGGYAGFLNGKVEAPTLRHVNEDGTRLIGHWDLSIGISGDRVHDVSGNELHGVTWQLPSRGMTGAGWDGTARSWQQEPAQYGAIHLHDDDLLDAGWDTDFTWTVPVGLRSGVYAARLRSLTDEDHIPFVVRPAVGARTARLAFLVPTASYLAYANEHMAVDLDFAERVHDHVPVLSPNEMHVAAHRELGNSLYDTHSDGSVVFTSSRLRPILNMRPKMQSWLGGGTGSGLWQLNADTHLLAWLTHEGVPFDCVTDEDLDREGAAALEGYLCVMTGTHPEYWSTRMRDGLDAFRGAGGRIMYMGGNGLYWRIAYHPSGHGAIEVRRGDGGTLPGENHHSFTGEYGGLWRRIGRPPNRSVAVGFVGQGFDVSSYFRRMPGSADPRATFIFAGVDDEIIGDFGLIGGGAAGIELDRADVAHGTPPHALVLARSENHTSNYLTSLDLLPINCLGAERANPIHADMVFHETEEGGAVFATGSIAWAGSLSHAGYANNVAAISRNVLQRFLDPTAFVLKDRS